ncbi:MAG TPA: hypothetical protein VGF88_08615 [Acidobacteriaceae bacterium]|jgi:hypothetical protein
MLLRRFASACLLFFSAVLVAQTSQPKPGPKAPKGSEATPSSRNAELPVRRVVLYKNGVGYFEHAGRVTGNQAVTIDFTSSQLDDALQSLTALDLGGGRITGVGYNSTTPLDQQLKNIPLGLDDNPSTEEVYGALRGAHVEVSGAGAATVSGRVVNYETRSQKTAAGDTVERPYLTIVSDAGAVRTFELTGTTSVRIIDGGLRRDLDEYLGLLASTQSQQVRHLTLQAQGTGARDIKVSYISEVPVWKSTYRIVFPDSGQSATPAPGPETAILQGWAVVDNTVGSDWSNVQLSLVAGAPQSFIEPLSQPIYTQRPEVPVPEAANIAPVTHEGAVAGPPPPASASETVTVNAHLRWQRTRPCRVLSRCAKLFQVQAAVMAEARFTPERVGRWAASWARSAPDHWSRMKPPAPTPLNSTTTSSTRWPSRLPSTKTSPPSCPSCRPTSRPIGSRFITPQIPCRCVRCGSPTPATSRSIAAASPFLRTTSSRAKA